MRERVKVQIISKGPCSDRFCLSYVAYFSLFYEWLKKKKTRRSPTSLPGSSPTRQP